MLAARRETRGARRATRTFWIRAWLLGFAINSSLYLVGHWLLPRLLHHSAGEYIVQSFMLSAGLVGLPAYIRWRQREQAPRLSGDGDPEVQSRHRITGKVLLSVAGRRLSGVDLSGAHLENVSFRKADLRGANLSGADLKLADLEDADLSGADLRGASLRLACLWNADLRGARLEGADMRGDLFGADLRDARTDAATRWPRRFRPEKRGCTTAQPSALVPAAPPSGRGDELTT